MNIDFVPFIRGVRVLCKPRLIFSRINGPNIILIFQPFSTQITPNFFLAIVEESGGIFIYLVQDTSFFI